MVKIKKMHYRFQNFRYASKTLRQDSWTSGIIVSCFASYVFNPGYTVQ